MNKHSALKPGDSLLERAAEIYDFQSAFRHAALQDPAAVEPLRPEPLKEKAPAAAKKAAPVEMPAKAAPQPLSPKPAARRQRVGPESARSGVVDRERLAEAGLILPDAPVSELAEEFRIIKRQLLAAARGKTGLSEEKRRTILVCSAQPDEGKTFCALNLALSMAGEQDLEVLLVDGDFAKPEILNMLGLEAGPGLIDAIADPSADVNDFIVKTDIGGLSVLPAGRQANNATELLASQRTYDVLAEIAGKNPKRIIIFDSPPVLMASPAVALAAHAGQVVLVVRADKTTEADLRETANLLSAAENISLMLNGTDFEASGRRFGEYYGISQ